jgi:hypothetical protein
MNMQKGIRAAAVAILVTGASLGLASGKASAEPRVCATLDQQREVDLRWVDYYDDLASSDLTVGDFDDAQLALAMAKVFNTLVGNALTIEEKLDC